MDQRNNWAAYSGAQVSYHGQPIVEAKKPSRNAGIPQAAALQMAYNKHWSGVDKNEITAVDRIILQLVTQANQDRLTYYKLLNEFENYYLCRAIYDVLIEEILKDTGDGVIIKIESEKYQTLCDEAMVKFNLPYLIESMLPQLLHYGDYTYKVNKSYSDDSDPIGNITSISDDFVPGEVMAVYNNGVPITFYRLPLVRSIRKADTIKNVTGSVLENAKELTMAEVMHFSLRSNRVKLELDDRHEKLFSTPVLNVGEGVLWGVIDRLTLLKYREISTVATDLSRLTRPTIVGAQVPQSDSADKIIDHCKNLESMLNSTNVSLDNFSGDFITAITGAMSNNYKVIPTFASGRGEARKLGIENEIDTESDDQKLQTEREMICQLAGVPPEIVLSTSGSSQSPQRIYVRLSKKVKSIQRSIARTLKIFLVHWIATQIDDLEVSETDIEVTMNSASNIEDIDDTEAIGYVLDNVKSLVEAAQIIKESKLIGSVPGPVDEDGRPGPDQGISPISGQRMMEYLRTEFTNAGSNAAGIWLTDDEIKNLVDSSGTATLPSSNNTNSSTDESTDQYE